MNSKALVGGLVLCLALVGCEEEDPANGNVTGGGAAVSNGMGNDTTGTPMDTTGTPVDDSGTTPEADAGGAPVAGEDTEHCDDPATRGNDCDTVVSCGKGADALSDPVDCPLSTHSCCVKGPAEGDEQCITGTSCTAEQGARTICDGPEDCPGADMQCCLTILADGAEMTCEADCAEAGASFTLCHGDAHCALGESCGDGGEPGVFPFWNTCQ